MPSTLTRRSAPGSATRSISPALCHHSPTAAASSRRSAAPSPSPGRARSTASSRTRRCHPAPGGLSVASRARRSRCHPPGPSSRTSATTSAPRARNRAIRCEPRKPVAPVRAMSMGRSLRGASVSAATAVCQALSAASLLLVTWGHAAWRLLVSLITASWPVESKVVGPALNGWPGGIAVPQAWDSTGSRCSAPPTRFRTSLSVGASPFTYTIAPTSRRASGAPCPNARKARSRAEAWGTVENSRFAGPPLRHPP